MLAFEGVGTLEAGMLRFSLSSAMLDESLMLELALIDRIKAVLDAKDNAVDEARL